MKKTLLISLLVLSVAVMALPAVVQAGTPLGAKLADRIFAGIKSKDWAGLEKFMSPNFQSVHTDGARDKAGELALLKKLDLGPYKLSDFQITRQGKVLVVSYKVSVKENLPTGTTSTTPAARLSIFIETPQGWKWLAHANLEAPAK